MRRYFVKSYFYGWREVTEQQFSAFCEHIRKNAVAMPPAQREQWIRDRTRIEE